jgi:uncharacterized protein (DUF1330 family)
MGDGADREHQTYHTNRSSQMPAYLIADVDITDPDAYAEYSAGVPATIAAHGGRYLARGGLVEVLEGSWTPGRTVVVEFPDIDALKTWYHSDEYVALMRIRKRASTASFIAVNGV